MKILPANPEDADVLTRLAFTAKRHWGYPDCWIDTWRDQLTVRPEYIRSHHVYAAALERRWVGFYGLRCEGQQGYLDHLWVLPDSMGKDAGRALFVHALDRARVMGVRMLEIESDPNAEGFYLRMGAHRNRVTLTTVEGNVRQLPVLLYALRE